MAQFCQNRPEGFGPHSNLHPNLPTTCFLDVIVEPLATWIFLVLLLTLLPMRLRALVRQRRRGFAFKPDEDDGGGGENGDDNRSRSSRKKNQRRRNNERNAALAQQHPPGVVSRLLSTLYYLLAVALVAMVSLEIARLSAARLGIGLLPFTYGGVVVALANRLSWRARSARLDNVLYWLMLAAAMAVKTATVQTEQMGPEIRVKDHGLPGMYPTSDQALDNAVMVGVDVALAALEFAGWRRLKAV